MTRMLWLSTCFALLALGCGGEDRPTNDDEGLSSLEGETAPNTDDTSESAEGEATDFTDDGAGQPCTDDSDCPGQICLPASGACGDPGSCFLDEDCPEQGQVCTDNLCMIGGDCGGFQFEIEAVPPNLLIMLDRSGSMDASVPDTNLNRWEVAKVAISQLTNGFDAKIRFGLATYSACVGNGCSAGTIVVPIADMNAVAINGFLDMTVGVGSGNGAGVDGQGKIEYLCDSGDPETSTGKSLNAQVGNQQIQDPARDNVILLITDGAESGDCIDNGIDGPAAAGNLFGQAIPVKTYAVGFGGANLDEINMIAQAGGTMQGYQADQADQLELALDQIANAVATCVFELDQVPPDPAEIYVFFDKLVPGVPNEGTNGWTYDPLTNTITFHGSSCEAIKAGTIVDIDIVYGCDEPPIG
ncbi:vWA domain-containing protein [Nannocystaceae bacterium ST9]